MCIENLGPDSDVVGKRDDGGLGFRGQPLVEGLGGEDPFPES